MPVAWVSNGDKCSIGAQASNCDEIRHSKINLSRESFKKLWGIGRGQDEDGIPILASDGRICFVAWSVLLQPALSTLPINALSTALSAISTSERPSRVKGPIVTHSHIETISKELQILLDSDFPSGKNMQLRERAKAYVKEIKSLLHRKKGHLTLSLANSIENLDLSSESDDQSELTASDKRRYGHFKETIHSEILKIITEIDAKDALSQQALVAGIGTISVLLLWWYSDRGMFEKFWEQIFGRTRALPSSESSMKLSPQLRARLEANIRSADFSHASPKSSKVLERRPSHLEAKDIRDIPISTVVSWWRSYMTWASLSFASVDIVSLAILVVFVCAIIEPKFRWVFITVKGAVSFTWNFFQKVFSLFEPFDFGTIATMQGMTFLRGNATTDPQVEAAAQEVYDHLAGGGSIWNVIERLRQGTSSGSAA
jgi:hypothetical protein